MLTKRTWKLAALLAVSLGLSAEFSLAQQATVNYTIVDWGVSGSQTFGGSASILQGGSQPIEIQTKIAELQQKLTDSTRVARLQSFLAQLKSDERFSNLFRRIKKVGPQQQLKLEAVNPSVAGPCNGPYDRIIPTIWNHSIRIQGSIQ